MMHLLRTILFYFTLGVLFRTSHSAAPTGCTYSDADHVTGLYTCDFTLITLPLVMNTFSSPNPQRLLINQVSGTLPASSPTATFSGFNGFNTGTMDTTIASSLEIVCSSGGSLVLEAGTFTGMSYIQELKIRNCIITSGLPSSIFSPFTELNSLIIDGGKIDSLAADSLSGLAIKELSVPNPLGLLALKNVELTTDSFPANFFNPITEAKQIVLDNIKTTATMSIPTDTFSLNTAVETLSLSHNSFTTINENSLSYFKTLNYLNITGIKYDCSCTSITWLLTYITDNDIDVIGGIVCDTPSAYQNKRATKYFYEMCPQSDACGTTSGVVLGGKCYSFQQFGESAGSLFAFIFAVVIFIYVYNERKKMDVYEIAQVNSVFDVFKGFRSRQINKDSKNMEATSGGLGWI